MIPKSFDAFVRSLEAEAPDSLWSEALKALWYDGKDNWEMAHNIAQDIPSIHGYCIHAYLHRKEGDQWNAGYWYTRANREFPSISLEAEFRALVRELISTVGK